MIRLILGLVFGFFSLEILIPGICQHSYPLDFRKISGVRVFYLQDRDFFAGWDIQGLDSRKKATSTKCLKKINLSPELVIPISCFFSGTDTHFFKSNFFFESENNSTSTSWKWVPKGVRVTIEIALWEILMTPPIDFQRRLGASSRPRSLVLTVQLGTNCIFWNFVNAYSNNG